MSQRCMACCPGDLFVAPLGPTAAPWWLPILETCPEHVPHAAVLAGGEAQSLSSSLTAQALRAERPRVADS